MSRIQYYIKNNSSEIKNVDILSSIQDKSVHIECSVSGLKKALKKRVNKLSFFSKTITPNLLNTNLRVNKKEYYLALDPRQQSSSFAFSTINSNIEEIESIEIYLNPDEDILITFF